MTIKNRGTGWLTPVFHARFRECLLHATTSYQLLCPAYCLMPDHCHVLLRGIHAESDQLLAIAFLRRALKPSLHPSEFQKQAYDHVLRANELHRDAFRSVAYYIVENPVRAKLVKHSSEYMFSGGLLAGKPLADIHSAKYWDVFWQMHMTKLELNGYVG